MKVPELYMPLVTSGLLRLWHDNRRYVFPPNSKATFRWAPSGRMIYLVFGLTFGIPRDNVGNAVITRLFGFKHKHSEMLWHTDHMVESVYLYRHPHHQKVTRNDPLILEWFNNGGVTLIEDVTIWLFECNEEDWSIVEKYFEGMVKKMTEEP